MAAPLSTTQADEQAAATAARRVSGAGGEKLSASYRRAARVSATAQSTSHRWRIPAAKGSPLFCRARKQGAPLPSPGTTNTRGSPAAPHSSTLPSSRLKLPSWIS